jgi:glycine cleavage system H protein
MRYYTEDHEWVEINGTEATIGISSHAVSELGELVYVELPEVGAIVAKGDECASVESVKTVSGIFAPVNGEVIARNERVIESPELINESPYSEGWIIKLNGASFDVSELMDEMAYDTYVKSL